MSSMDSLLEFQDQELQISYCAQITDTSQCSLDFGKNMNSEQCYENGISAWICIKLMLLCQRLKNKRMVPQGIKSRFIVIFKQFHLLQLQ